MNSIQRNKLRDKIQIIQGLTDEERSALLGLLNESKTYGLVWEDKPEAIEERLRTELPVLKEVKSKTIISDNAEAPNHIIIEGDNLESLTTLAYTHEGKIDVIYIDPPYNTGNKDFVYNDSYVDSEDSYRHSKWLSFMAKRLRIAKKLLSDRGVIFISIDDNEQANIKLLCDEIFGEKSFLQEIIIESNPRGSQSSKYFANTHEYLFVYSKRINPEISFGLKKNEKEFSEYSHEDSRGRYRLLGLRQRGGAWKKEDRPLLHYPIFVNPQTREVSLKKDDAFCIKVIPQRPTGEFGRWTWSSQKLKNQLNEVVGVLVNEGTDKEKWDIARKNYLEDENGEVRLTKVKSLWIEKEINYQNGGTEVKDIIGDGVFSYPKPLFLLRKILSISTDRESFILDFFAGSGTTLHAVMQLNAEEGGKRQCILCTNNENGICEKVTYERNKRVIQGYTKPNGEEVAGLSNNNLRYYKTAFVGRRRTPQNMRRLMLLASDMLCIKENLYTELDAFGELQTLENGVRYFAQGDKQMLIVYNEEAIYTIIEQLEQMTVCEPIVVYVFSPGNDAWNSEFVTVSEKVRLTALPSAIYNAYKRVLPKPKDMSLTAETESSEPVIETEHTLFDSEEGENE